MISARRRASIVIFSLALTALLPPSGCSRREQVVLGEFRVEHELPLRWQELAPGLSYARLEFSRTTETGRVVLAAVRAEPARCEFQLLDAPALLDQPAGAVEDMAEKAGVVVAANASFYLPDSYKPIGLIVAGGKVRNDWKKAAGSGIFWVKDGKAGVDWSRVFQKSWEQAELALQAGPLIIEPDGRMGIRSNTKKYRARTAVGLDGRRRVVLACTLRMDDGEELRGLDLYELMQILAADERLGGLGLKAALNLDGGTSTAFSLRHPSRSLMAPSLHPVPNGIGLRPRGKPWN